MQPSAAWFKFCESEHRCRNCRAASAEGCIERARVGSAVARQVLGAQAKALLTALKALQVRRLLRCCLARHAWRACTYGLPSVPALQLDSKPSSLWLTSRRHHRQTHCHVVPNSMTTPLIPACDVWQLTGMPHSLFCCCCIHPARTRCVSQEISCMLQILSGGRSAAGRRGAAAGGRARGGAAGAPSPRPRRAPLPHGCVPRGRLGARLPHGCAACRLVPILHQMWLWWSAAAQPHELAVQGLLRKRSTTGAADEIPNGGCWSRCML